MLRARATRLTRYLRDLAFRGDTPATFSLALGTPSKTGVGPLPLADVLRRTGVKMEEFAEKRAVMWAGDIDSSLQKYEQEETQLPLWLAVYLLSFKVRTPAQASGAGLKLALGVGKEDQAPLLVLSTMHLVRFRLMSPLQNIVDAFLATPPSLTHKVHFNHLLLALSALRSSHDARALVIQLLEAMEARGIRLWDRTCTVLLNDRYAVLKLTHYLHQRSLRLHEKPTPSHLKVYLRTAAITGDLPRAEQHFAAIKGRGPKAENVAHAKRDLRAHRINAARSQLIRAQPSFDEAIQYFQRTVVQKASREKPFGRIALNHPRNLLGKRAADIKDWNAALAVAERDGTVNGGRLIRVLERLRPSFGEYRPNARTWEILVRGLLKRREWRLAYDRWKAFLSTGQPMTPGLLKNGLRAMILAGQPHEAVALLEVYRTLVTAEIIEHVMAALVEVLRPDVVFRLWDALHTLYRVTPAPEMLVLLFRAAQLPHLLDDSFAGQMALLSSKFQSPSKTQKTREELARDIYELASEPYQSGLWRGEQASQVASAELYTFLGPETMSQLASAPLPAAAMRPHAESGRVGYALPPLDYVPRRQHDNRGHVLLSSRVWAEYILLLGLTRRAPEIARTLAWMRTLGIALETQTVGFALAFWAEVAVHPPLLGVLMKGRGDGYEQLRVWLAEDGQTVPKEEDVRVWHAKIEMVRRLRRESVERGRYRMGEEARVWAMEKW
ncbi:hypothetical protein MIND_00958800 [Mycena indigotica]|uniref:Uncharacterized protein n=1 Tax=Mycena indigotica TaxID=2126181 RepID=A0A8H6VZ76_9AGAR|nr:uncharacterized protein MIND_00958800 [Mycena indigotica]KAF7297256.1 hypothetical protein MIND_00958800 [Mycena indigotica]